MRNIFAAAAVCALFASQAQALSITALPSGAATGATLANTLLSGASGITITGVSYLGANNQAGTYTGFNFAGGGGQAGVSLGNGIVLTSGTANIPGSNGSTNFGQSLNTAGDADLSAITGRPSNDANVLTISFTVAAGINSIKSNFIFGSDEFPEYAGTQFQDGFGFIVDGTNYAKFQDNTIVSLANISSNLNFLNNGGNVYPIEYDGITPRLTVTGLLDTNLSTHTLKLVIADTGDSILDSGVFLSTLAAGQTDGGGGIIVTPAIPEPETYALMLAGLAAVGAVARRRRQG